MTPNRLHQATAFGLSLLLTLALFAGVASLAEPAQAGPLLVQLPAPGSQG